MVFGDLVDRHAGAIHGYLGRRLGTAAADEMLVEVFAIAFERRGAYRAERDEATPWLYGIAANVVRRHREREARWERGPGRAEALSASAGDSFADREDRVAAAQAWPRVAACLRSLPAIEREALLLFAWEGLTYAEIATALEVPLGTVRSRLARARHRMREHLGTDPGCPDDRRAVFGLEEK